MAMPFWAPGLASFFRGSPIIPKFFFGPFRCLAHHTTRGWLCRLPHRGVYTMSLFAFVPTARLGSVFVIVLLHKFGVVRDSCLFP
jgi:hypothetical protein